MAKVGKTGKWLRVTTTDYYEAWETLGERRPAAAFLNNKVRGGTRIQVRWPDRSVTDERVVVRVGSDTEQVDMNGRPDRFDTQTLYVRTTIRGLRVEVPLRMLRFRPVRT